MNENLQKISYGTFIEILWSFKSFWSKCDKYEGHYARLH